MKKIIFYIALSFLCASYCLHAQKDGREYEEAGRKNEAEKVLKLFPEGAKHESLILKKAVGRVCRRCDALGEAVY